MFEFSLIKIKALADYYYTCSFKKLGDCSILDPVGF